jgi:hypothetical protein
MHSNMLRSVNRQDKKGNKKYSMILSFDQQEISISVMFFFFFFFIYILRVFILPSLVEYS